MLERMIDHIRSFPDVWIATGEEIAEFWRDHERDMHPGRGNR
jgi:hypothetical protein